MSTLNQTQLWALSLGNGIAVMNNVYTDRLEIEDLDNNHAKKSWTQAFDRDWGITDRKTLDETCSEMIEGGGHGSAYDQFVKDFCALSEDQFLETIKQIDDPKQHTRARLVYAHRFSLGRGGIKAWDIGRIAFVLRQGYFIGLLTEEECWQKLFTLARFAQPLYSDWHNYGFAYYVGRFFWRSDSVNETACATAFSGFNSTLGDPQSAYNQLDWNMTFDDKLFKK